MQHNTIIIRKDVIFFINVLMFWLIIRLVNKIVFKSHYIIYKVYAFGVQDAYVANIAIFGAFHTFHGVKV